jgi:TPR repeat protein
MYSKGKGYSQNYYKAKELYEKACQAGNSYGCNNLGDFYCFGKGVQQDYNKAKELYKKSCEAGNSFGCKNLDLINQ